MNHMLTISVAGLSLAAIIATESTLFYNGKSGQKLSNFLNAEDVDKQYRNYSIVRKQKKLSISWQFGERI